MILNLSLAFNETNCWLILKLDIDHFSLRFYDLPTNKKIQINLPFIDRNDPTDEIFDFTAIGFRVVLVLSISKNVIIYDLIEQTLFCLDQAVLNSLDIEYFSPISVTSHFKYL